MGANADNKMKSDEMKSDQMKSNDCECAIFFNNFEVVANKYIKDGSNFVVRETRGVESKEEMQAIIDQYKILQILLKDTQNKFLLYANKVQKCKNDHKDSNFIVDSMEESIILLSLKVEEKFKKIKEKYSIEFFAVFKKFDNEQKILEKQLSEKEEKPIPGFEGFKVDLQPIDLEKFKKEQEEIFYDKIEAITEEMKDLVDKIGKQIEDDNKKILEAKENIEIAEDYSSSGTSNLKSAAEIAIKNKNVRNKAIFTPLFFAIGSVVPVVGNVLGVYFAFKLANKITEGEKKELQEINKGKK